MRKKKMTHAHAVEMVRVTSEALARGRKNKIGQFGIDILRGILAKYQKKELSLRKKR